MFLLLRPQNHSAPVKIAQRNQGQRAVSFFVFCHSSGSARKALASEVVEQDGSTGIEGAGRKRQVRPGLERKDPHPGLPRAKRSSSSPMDVSGKYPCRITGLFAEGKRAKTASGLDLRNPPPPARGESAFFFFFYIPCVKAAECVEKGKASGRETEC